MMAKNPVCRSCGAEIIWVRIEGSRKLMPINRQPVHNGNIEITSRSWGELVGHMVNPTIADGPRYISHFANCPDAKHWRTQKRSPISYEPDYESIAHDDKYYRESQLEESYEYSEDSDD